jgi:uncharacterized membrane protein YdfJ with MMPL/SSD domain
MFAVCYPFSIYVYHFWPEVPSIMMSLLIAFSIDYNLFLLTRYREEIEKGNSNYDSTKIMLKNAGQGYFNDFFFLN